MKTYFDHHFPIQQTKIKYSNRNEWINKVLKNEIIERERLFIYKKKYPTQENIDVYKSSETKISNELHRTLALLYCNVRFVQHITVSL